jgi:superoxide dismutase, Cu-Zn family
MRKLIGFALAYGAASLVLPSLAESKAFAKMQDMAVAKMFSVQDGKLVSRGTAQIKQRPKGIELRVAIENPVDGTLGIHIHSIGKCDAPDFKSAGPHWNPGNKQHGRDNPAGSHNGDLPNMVSKSGKKMRYYTFVAGAKLSDLMDADGAALVLHEKADDYITDPSGNSGARMICGVFAIGRLP